MPLDARAGLGLLLQLTQRPVEQIGIGHLAVLLEQLLELCEGLDEVAGVLAEVHALIQQRRLAHLGLDQITELGERFEALAFQRCLTIGAIGIAQRTLGGLLEQTLQRPVLLDELARFEAAPAHQGGGQAMADGVEGADVGQPCARRGRLRQLGDEVLARRAVEHQHQNPLRRNAFRQQAQHPRHQRGGLAGARHRRYPRMPPTMRHHGALLIRQPLRQLIDGQRQWRCCNVWPGGCGAVGLDGRKW